MWSPLLFCLLIGFVAGDGPWQSGYKYVYEFNTRTLTALADLSNNWTGLLGNGFISINVKSDNEIIGKITVHEESEVKRAMPAGWKTHVPRDQLNFKAAPLNGAVFSANVHNGIIKNLTVDKSMRNEEVNLLKGLLSQLFVDTYAENEIKYKQNQLPSKEDPTAAYKVMEPTVTGECETMYDISRIPDYMMQSRPEWAPLSELKSDNDDFMEIVKTKNYSNCDQHVELHQKLTGDTPWKPNANQMGTFLSRSAVSRIVASGNIKNYVIQSSVTTNKIIASPGMYDSQKAMIISQVNLTINSRVQSNGGSGNSGPSSGVNVGNLVYRINLPSDRDNKVRPAIDTEYSDIKSGSSNPRYNGQSQKSSRRVPRSSSDENNSQYDNGLNENDSNGSSDQDDSDYYPDVSVSVETDHHNPMPTSDNVPERPLSSYYVGNQGSLIKYATDRNIDIKQSCFDLISEIATDIASNDDVSEQNSLIKFNILVRLLRLLNTNELRQLSDKSYATIRDRPTYNEVVKHTQWKVYRDALAQAGTGPAVKEIGKLINEHQLREHEAGRVVATLPSTIQYPTEDIVLQFFNLCRSKTVKEQEHLNATCITAVTEFMENSIVNSRSVYNYYSVHVFGKFRDNDSYVVDTVIPYLGRELQSAVKNGDSHGIQVYTRALGNLGHQKILTVFKGYLQGRPRITDYQRLIMVLSLDKLVRNHPRSARSVLFKIYENVGEDHAVRCAAVFLLIRTNPPVSMLQRMAEMTNYEESMHVRSAVASVIISAAKLQNPSNHHLSEKAQTVKKMLSPKILSMYYSTSDVRDYIMVKVNLGYKRQVSTIGSSDSFEPSSILYTIQENVGGFMQRPNEYNYIVSSVERLVDSVKDQLRKQETDNGKPSQDSLWTLEKLQKYIKMGSEKGDELEGQITLDFANSKLFKTFNNQSLNDLPKMIKKLAQALYHEKTFNYTKLYGQRSISLAAPLEQGIPYVYSLDVPTFVKMGGSAEAQTKPNMAEGPDDFIRKPNSVSLKANITFTYATITDAQLGFFHPHRHYRFVSGYTRKHHMQLPLSFNFDASEKGTKVKLGFNQPEKTQKLWHVENIPYISMNDILTLRPNSESDDNTKILIGENHLLSKKFGENSIGMAFELHGSHNFKYDDAALFLKYISNRDALQLVSSPLKWDSSNFYRVSFYYNGDQSSTKNVEVRIRHKAESFQNFVQSENLNKNENMENLGEIAGQGSRGLDEVLRRASLGLSDCDASVLSVNAKFNSDDSNRDGSAAFFVAYGDSNVGDNSRVIIGYDFDSVSSDDKDNFQMCMNAYTHKPNVPQLNYKKTLEADPSSESYLNVMWGKNCKDGSAIKAKVFMTQTKERKNYLKSSGMHQGCMQEIENNNYGLSACQNASYHANQLDKYSASISTHNLSPRVQEAAYSGYSYIRHWLYNYHSEDIFNKTGLKDEVQIEGQFAPDMQSANFSVASERIVGNFSNVRLNRWAQAVFASHPDNYAPERLSREAFRQDSDPTCTCDTYKMLTFDNTTYAHATDDCWHVLFQSKPTASHSLKHQNKREKAERVAILGRRRISEDNKEIYIVVGQFNERDVTVYLLPSSQTNPRVFVNEQEIKELSKFKTYTISRKQDKPFSNGEEESVVKVWINVDGEINVNIRDKITVIYNGVTTIIHADNSYRDNVHGMCGTFNSESSDDFTTPDNCIVNNTRLFAAAYTLPSDENANKDRCNRIISMYQNAKRNECIEKSRTWGNVVSDQDAGMPWRYDDTDGRKYKKCSTKYQYQFITDNNTTCFTARAVPVCTPDCKPRRRSNKKIPVVCFNHLDTRVNHYKQLISRGVRLDLNMSAANRTVTFQVAHECMRLN